MKFFFTLFLSFCIATVSLAQKDTSKNVTSVFTYAVDAYYRYDFANAPNGDINNKTSFTNSANSFELGMASVRMDHTTGKVGATIDLGFGRRAEEFSYNDKSILASIKQLFVSYAPFNKLKFTFGKFATHIGYESVDAYANRNYSMSYAFSYGPFFYTGIKADFTVSKSSAIMIGIANPTDYSTTTSTGKIYIAQWSIVTQNAKLKAYLNYQGGTNNVAFNADARYFLNQLDWIMNYAFNDKFSVVYDGTVQSRKAEVSGASLKIWSSNVIYLNYDPRTVWGLTLRCEYLNDQDNVIGIGSRVFIPTLSVNYRVHNLTIIPELRLDKASATIFSRGDGTSVKNAGSFLLALTYKL
ncbi:MAG: porin [Bacteroidota bacterium]|nr:porin [Bacteroidota bacterium]